MSEQTIISLAVTLVVTAVTIFYVGFWVRHDDMAVCRLSHPQELCASVLK